MPVLTKPRACATGMTVGVICPASPPKSEEGWTTAGRQLRDLGFEVRWSPVCEDLQAGKPHGNHAARVADLHWAFAETDIDIVWAIRGGYGCLPLLPAVDFDLIARNPKPLLGFSDLTALTLVIHGRTGLVTFHAPMPSLPLTAYSRGELLRVLGGSDPAGTVNPLDAQAIAGVLPPQHVTIHGGTAEGPLLPGNLALLMRLIGTPFQPDFRGRILCIEDVGEAPHRVHGYLTQLLLAGRLQELAGIALGSFLGDEPKLSSEDLAIWQEVFADRLRRLKIPVFWGLPLGHIDSQTSLPVGVSARIRAEEGLLELLDGAVL